MDLGPGTRALVTGATKGIGRALAEALAARGATVGLIARGAEELAALAARLGPRAFALPCDVGDAAQLTAAIDRFAAEAGGLDLAIANAGGRSLRPLRGPGPGAARADDPDQLARHA